jgi:hypothetical protein
MTSDWKLAHVGLLEQMEFSPAYAGDDFAKALNVAKMTCKRVWEDDRTRAWWIVSEERPPFAMTLPDNPNRFDANWSEV